MAAEHEIVIVGGSAGSLAVVSAMVAALDNDFPYTFIIVVHRQRNVSSDLVQLLKPPRRNLRVLEPDDKEKICTNTVYVAPQNYHLLTDNGHFSLDYSEPVMYSRPSIDVSFESFALAYKSKVTGIILSGANSDGTQGLKTIVKYGGQAIAQSPESAAYPVMPKAAIAAVQPIETMTTEELINYIANKR